MRAISALMSSTRSAVAFGLGVAELALVGGKQRVLEVHEVLVGHVSSWDKREGSPVGLPSLLVSRRA